jgi:diguanylate cyclase (GGDEF)-like protein/PAS domain S-box-containing protein
MDRVASKPAFVAEALQLTGAPACACDVNGMVVAANPELTELFGVNVEGRPLVELFRGHAARAAARILLAFERECRWDDLVTVRSREMAVQVRAKPLPPGAGMPGATFVFTDVASVVRERASALHTALVEQRAIFEHAPVGIALSHPGVFKSCNPRWAQMFGYTPDEIAGKSARDMFASRELYERFVGEAAEVVASGRLFEKCEHQFCRRDGSLFWGRVCATAIDPQSPEAGTIWMIEDVTEARQTFIEVQSLMANASVSILFTRDRVITRYNRGFAEMFGYGDDDVRGMHARALYATERAYVEFGDAAEEQLSQGRPFQAETELLRKDGRPMWAQLIGCVINPDDPAQGTIWIIEDRTRHKQDEESLRDALLENQAILDNAVLGIAVVERGRTLHCNRKMEELFGYEAGGITGCTVRSLYPDAAGWLAAREDAGRDFGAGRVHMAEQQLVRKDGSRFWARLSGRPFDLLDGSGRSVWLVDDVTAQREAADVLRRARDELEVRVRERTAELAGANALLQEEIVERRQAEARVHHMAYHDSLTGLPNRALLADRLERAMLAAQRGGSRLAVMFIDLDRFKTINDSLGHLTGDHLLREVASRLCRAVRMSDTVARLGGDEFVVLVPGVQATEECAQVGDKIIEALRAPFPFEGRSLHISPSIGVCMYPEDGADVETLMRNADAAMYHAKAAGRNNYQFFTQRMNQAAAQHFELESSLRTALAGAEFELFYQPIMDAGTRAVHALEVLLRWRRPGTGLVLPDHFIPLLEETGLIVPVGEWVLRAACEQAMAWQRAGIAAVPLAINLSARQFMHAGLLASIESVIGDTGIDPALIEFEITETALMQHGAHTLDLLDRINRMGIRLSIDDFGTGYSSLAYLKRFPVRKIKIDRAFVRELEASSEDRAIVAAVMALANSLQLSVVAEGVETEAQLALLQAHGCQYAQGYLFARPLPAGEAGALLAGPPQAA